MDGSLQEVVHYLPDAQLDQHSNALSHTLTSITVLCWSCLPLHISSIWKRT